MSISDKISINQNLYSRGFPTNRIPVTIPSSGQFIILREATIVEIKSICKTVIDNLSRKQMDVIYDSVSEFLQSIILTDGVDVNYLTEFDRLYCLMVFFQISIYKDATDYKCPNCGVDISYRYDMSKYLSLMEQAYIDDQQVSIEYKSKIFEFNLGWPSVNSTSDMTRYFYTKLGVITEQMEQTQLGINVVMSFIKNVTIVNRYDQSDVLNVDMTKLCWEDRLEIINSLPSMVVFDQNIGVIGKITGYFINRLENCFKGEKCPQCHKDTYYGLSQSSHFYSLFYGSLKSIYAFILQVECLLVYRYCCMPYESENYMTYNDFNCLVKQLGTTMEKEEKEKKKIGSEPLTKGLWYIREILNNLVFPQDKKH